MSTRDALWELRRWDTPTLCNAIELLGVRDRTQGFLGHDIKCLFPKLAPLVGFAVTGRYSSTTPGPPPSPNLMPLWEAVASAPKPAVIVMSDASSDRRRSCGFGEVMATLALACGAIGVVTDGNVRDLTEVHRLGFQYFAGGIVPAHGNFQVLDVNVPVSLDGTTVRPGDVIHGDENGVAVFPPERLVDLRVAAATVREREANIMRAVGAEGVTLADIRASLQPLITKGLSGEP